MGAMAPKTAMLQAVNMPPTPVMNAKTAAAVGPVMATLVASPPTTGLAMVPAMTLSTRLGSHKIDNMTPASALPMTRSRFRCLSSLAGSIAGAVCSWSVIGSAPYHTVDDLHADQDVR